jgi:hypothetical protein
MTWLAWRQFRTSMAIVAGAVAVLAVILLVTHPGLIDMYRSSGLAGCTGPCEEAVTAFRSRVTDSAAEPVYFVGFGAVYVIPAIIGLFWGAPMVARELENGTYRLVWSQSTTRSRWLAVKLVAGAAGAMVAAGLLALAVTWWSAPIDRAAGNRLSAEVFGARGVVPIAYAAFAFVLGVLLGTVIRRTVPAMALTLVLVAAVQLLMPTMVRGHLIPPKTYTGAITAAPGEEQSFEELTMGINDGFMHVVPKLNVPGAWVLENRALTASGKEFDGPFDEKFCGLDAASGPHGCEKWVLSQNLHQDAVYQPASRFWPLQWVESALILVVTAMLTGLCFWWIRRRLS